MRKLLMTCGIVAFAAAGCTEDSAIAMGADVANSTDVTATPDTTGGIETTETSDTVSPTPDSEISIDVPADAEAPPDDVPEVCPVDTPCDDGDPCTDGDVCDGLGGCSGPPTCDDGLACTTDACSEAGACSHTFEAGYCVALDVECVADGDIGVTLPCLRCDASAGVPVFLDVKDGDPCSDGDACTLVERCLDGECLFSAALGCPEKGPCVDAVCDPGAGCVYPEKSGACDDGSLCTTEDACYGPVCTGNELVCDDQDPCTNDKCTDKLGCVTTPSDLCDDGKPCTADVCSGGGACTNTPYDGACEDGDPCTKGETCTDNVCSGGSDVACDDGTPCTTDFCSPGIGCQHHFDDDAVCSDGYSCTSGDTCVAGLCLGNKDFCGQCPKPVTGDALKIVQLTFATDGLPGSALDIDEDPTTCAPDGKCSGGIDNAMGVLAPFINDPISQSMEAGSILYAVDLSQLTTDGEPFPFSVLDAKLGMSALSSGCDFMAQECDYVASQFSFDPSCTPYFGLPNATVNGATFKAGGKGYVMTIAVAFGNTTIPITLVNARVEAVVVRDPVTKVIVGLSGIFGGASPKQQLYDTIANLNDALLPVDKTVVLGLIDSLVVNDIDLDENGGKDAASVAMRFITIPGNLVSQ